MSTPSSSGDSTARPNRGWLLTTAGALIVAAIFFALNWFFSLSSANLDFTEHKVHTLADGTKNILDRVDTDVTIKLFVSPTDDLPPQFRPVVGQVEGWLQRYYEMAPDYIKIQKLVVEPASDEEQDAAASGIQPQRNLYFGITTTCLDKTSVIPWVPALFAPFVDQDRIEFGLSAAITEVIAQKKKVVGLMTPLQMTGNAMPFGGQGQPAWALYEAIKSQYEVKTIELTTTRVDPSIDVLLMVHPAGISDEAQWAVDQYLLGGGRVIAFLDPYNFIASRSGQPQPGMPPGMSPGAIPTGSNLSKLLGAWGYSFEADKIVADLNYATPDMGPLLLTLGTDAIRKDSDITKQLTDFWLIFSGAFTGTAATGIEEKIFLTTSVKNQLVDTSYASANPGSPQAQTQMDRLMRTFQSEGKERILAMQLTGKFKTAFPEGKPAPPPPSPPSGGMPPGFNFGGPQGAEGQPGAEAAPAAAPPAETPVPPTETPAPPAETPAPPAAEPAPPAATPAPPVEEKPADAAAPASPSAATPPVTVPATEATTAPIAIPAAGEATPPADPLLPPPATPAAGSTPIPVAPSGDPNQPAPLKESTKDGLVYLVADADMLADVLTPRILQNSNLPFALNLVDQAAGDQDLMGIRSRGSARRPFDTLNNIRAEANERIKNDLQSMNSEVEKLNTDIQSQKTSKDRNNALFAGLRAMEAKQREINKRIYEKQKEANKEVKAKENFIQWINILLMPLLIALAGLAVFVLRKVKTSAR